MTISKFTLCFYSINNLALEEKCKLVDLRVIPALNCFAVLCLWSVATVALEEKCKLLDLRVCIQPTLAYLYNIAEDHVIHQGRIDFAWLESGPGRDFSQSRAREVLEFSAIGSKGCALGSHNENACRNCILIFKKLNFNKLVLNVEINAYFAFKKLLKPEISV